MFTGPDKEQAILVAGGSILDEENQNQRWEIQNLGCSIWQRLFRRGGGFTLLEIMLAVAILGMMSIAIFRFVQSNMMALQLSSATAASDAQYDGLRDLLSTR